jgi:acyl-coenzyme A thioesterase PaaI-like protein
MTLNIQSLISQLRNWNDGSRNLAKEGWDYLSKLPRGKRIYSYLIGRYAPYTGTIDAQVEELRMGHSKVTLKDTPGIRNHLRSIHAIALANFAEVTGNIALSYSMPPDARFIVSKMELEYLKKARGKLTGMCDCPVPSNSEKKNYLVPVRIRDEAGDIVCSAVLHSLVGPKL